MTPSRTLPLITAAMLTGLLAGCNPGGGGAAAPDAAKDAVATPAQADPGYAALAKLPDWSGVWEPTRFARPAESGTQGPPPRPKLTPEYEKQYAAFEAKNRSTPGINFVSNVADCLPPGLPGSMTQPYPIEFLFTPGRVTIVIETYSMVRRIYTDGSPMPAHDQLDPSYQGTSVGHWEGDTLVVETAGILPETSPFNGINGHSDQMKVTERMRLVDPDTLEIVTTREDPAVFAEPFTTTARYARHRDWKIMEYVCAQNNHDALDEHGNAAFSLERKPGE
jgi:hypothetical protein